jgi:hypothetical protein
VFKTLVGIVTSLCLISTIYAQDNDHGWFGSGSSGSQITTGNKDATGTSKTSTFDIGKVRLYFPVNAKISKPTDANAGNILYYTYDGLNVISDKPNVGYNTMKDVIKLYAPDRAPEGTYGEWTYQWVNTGHGVVYAAKHRSLPLFMSGIAANSVVRDEDVYVKAVLNNVRAQQVTEISK